MTFIQTLKTRQEVRRLFGKKELIIIEKQARGIPLTPSEKTRLSRDIRKKFKAIQALIPYESEFELKPGVEIKRKIENIKERILESEYYPKIKRIALFGSVAEKTHLFRSDIDIAVEFDAIDLREATQFRIKFNGDEKVDVQVYNILPEKIRKAIRERGKVLYERKN